MKFIDIITEDNSCEAKRKTARKIFKLFNKGFFIANDDESKYEYEFIGNENNIEIVCYGKHNKIELLIKSINSQPFPFSLKLNGEPLNINEHTFSYKETMLKKIGKDIGLKLNHFKIMVIPMML